MAKVAIFIWDVTKIGGIESLSLDIASVLKKNGHEPVLVSFFGSIECPDSVRGIPVRTIGNRPKGNGLFLRAYTKLKKLWDSPNHRLADLTSGFDALIVMHVFLLRFVSNCRVERIITWVHLIEVSTKNSKNFVEFLKYSDEFVAVSRFTQNYFRTFTQTEREVHWLPNTVDLEKYQAPAAFDFTSCPVRLLTVSRMSKSESYKGHDLVLQALRKMNNELNWEYHIVGDGDGRKGLEKLCEDHPHASRIFFHGRVSNQDLQKHYQECHVFVMPSYFSTRPDGSVTGEGFGIAYLEAMACKKPVIAAEEGGQTDCIENGKNGLLVKPDVDSVAEAIRDFIGKPDKMKSMGENGFNRAQTEFQISIFERRLLTLLKF